MSSLSSSSTKTNRRERREKSPYFAGAKDGPLPELEVIESLLLFHLDDERHDQHQEGGPGDLGHLARAAHQLFGHGRAHRTVHRHLRAGDVRQDAVALGAAPAHPTRRLLLLVSRAAALAWRSCNVGLERSAQPPREERTTIGRGAPVLAWSVRPPGEEHQCWLGGRNHLRTEGIRHHSEGRARP
jgi:hypothetical protein